MGEFSAKVSAWVRSKKERIVATRNLAVEKVVGYAQTPVGAGGNMPIKSGFLRASIASTRDGSIPMKTYKPDGDGVFTYTGGGLTLTLAGADMDDVITVGWTANYARYAENKNAFMRLAAQRWPEAVREASRELEAAVTTRKVGQ